MKKLLFIISIFALSIVLLAQQTATEKIDAAIVLLNEAKTLLNPAGNVDCVVAFPATPSSTTEWAPAACAVGSTQTRTSTFTGTITTPQSGTGAACGPLTKSVPESRACPVPPQPGTPVALSIMGAVTHGQTVIINGSGFGTKAQAAPVKYDDFQNLTIGQDLSANGWKTAGGVHPRASTTKLRPGTPFTKNALAEFKSSIPYNQGGDASNFYLTGQAFKKAYLDFWIYSHVVSGTPGNQKPVRWHATGAGSPNVYLNLYQPPGTDNVCAGRDGTAYSDSAWCTTTAFYENWRHVQYLLDIGSGMASADGSLRVSVDSKVVYDHQRVPVWSGGAAGIPELYLGNYLRTDEGAGLQNSWDSVYVDNSWARVEIGNAAAYEACTHREVQIVTSWSPTTISVRVNRGSFPSLTGQYLFIVDAFGIVSYGFKL